MNKKEKQIFTGLFLALGFLIALGIAGNGDLEEAETQARVYTEMVCAGHWPDYENRNPDCGS
jgi:hypothetical protein